MKHLLYSSIIISMLFASCYPVYVNTPSDQGTTVVPTTDYQQQPQPYQEEASYQVFYTQLAPYGRWIDYPGEGYVFSPNVDASFQPYSTNGYWVYTEHGWSWTSGYKWGWAPFHYGRWFYEDGYGWLWLPGHEWAPAWVTWGQCNGYYGWAPLGPHIDVNQHWTAPERSWTFVRAEQMNNRNLSRYTEGREHNHDMVSHINIINNTSVINHPGMNNGGDHRNDGNNQHQWGNNGNGNTGNQPGNNPNSNPQGNNQHQGYNNGGNTNNTPANPNTNMPGGNNQHQGNNNGSNTNNQPSNNQHAPAPTVVNHGPRPAEITPNTDILQHRIIENPKPTKTQVKNNNLIIFKPNINPNANQPNGTKPAPTKVAQYEKH